MELSQSIEVRTQALARLQADLNKARTDLAVLIEAGANARAVLECLTSANTANPAQTDCPQTSLEGISLESVQTDAETVDPLPEGDVTPALPVPADGDSPQEQPTVGGQGDGN